jgi:hypothetical protein
MPFDAPEDLPKEDPGQVTLVREDGAGRPADRMLPEADGHQWCLTD